jgi:hypothetical protein
MISVISMKMMSSTSMTSTSGVTLMSLRTASTCAFLLPDSRWRRFAWPALPESFAADVDISG